MTNKDFTLKLCNIRDKIDSVVEEYDLNIARSSVLDAYKMVKSLIEEAMECDDYESGKLAIRKLDVIRTLMYDYCTINDFIPVGAVVFVGKRNISKCVKPYLTLQIRLINCKLNELVSFFAL